MGLAEGRPEHPAPHVVDRKDPCRGCGQFDLQVLAVVADLDLGDAVTVLGHLFAGTGPLPDPFALCGADPTADTVDCAAFPPCDS